MGATLGVSATILILTGYADPRLFWLGAALFGLTILGLVDDVRPLSWRLKLVVQLACAVTAVEALPLAANLGSMNLWWVKFIAAAFLVTTINFINFIDGIDEITVAHALPSLSVPVLLAALGVMSVANGIVAASAMGAIAGFWIWNRHPARVFLGDCGSLPLGLLLGWFGLVLCIGFHPLSGLTILLYPLADGGLTLLRRLLAREAVTQPHRQHAYQRAVDAGLSAQRVAGTVGVISLLTALLCLLGLWLEQSLAIAATAFIGALVVTTQIGLWYVIGQPRRN